jgi:peptidoglycan/LPS O-acetylase OafA/YrhL
MSTAVQEPKIASRQHLGSLDLLRGFAALSVLLYHFTYDGGLVKFTAPHVNQLFFWGNMGVEVFFVISGFIIPYSLWGTGYRLPQFFSFMRKRIVRIVPPAYVCVLLILLQWAAVDYLIKKQHPGRLEQLSASQLAGNALFLYSFKDAHWINGVFWTLSLEFQFYLLVGVLYSWLFEKGVLAFVGVFLAVTASCFIFGFSTHSFSAYAPLFAMGGATLLFKKGRIPLWTYLALLALFSGLAYFTTWYLSTWFGLATALFIAFVQVRHSIFAFFGRISYSLYLVHLLVGGTAEFTLAKFFHPQTELGNAAVIGICIGLAIGFAYLFHRFVELPFMQLARRLKA